MTNLSWQPHALTRQTPVKSQPTPICNMAAAVQWHSRRVTVDAHVELM